MRRAPPVIGAVTRRGLLRLLSGASWLAVAGPAGAAGDKILDQGIGGTGIRPGTDDEGDRGIGGTGVVGTIRGFGSIIVNDLRIAYPPDVPVTVDGRPARVEDLRVGQVVRTLAQPGENGLSTGGIAVIHEVVGPVQRVAGDRLTVLGQSVATAGLPPEMPRPRLGERVAVSGLRRPDGGIAASRIDPAGSAPDLVAGPVRRGPGGTLRIGNLALSGLDPALAGGRAVAEGTLSGSRLAVTRAVSATEPFGAEARRLSIEAYVTREGGALRTGAGYAVVGRGGLVPAGGGLAILDGRAGRGGRLDLDAVRLQRDPAGRDGGRGADGSGPGRAGPGRGGPGGSPGGARDGSRGGSRGGSPDGPGGGHGGPGGRLGPSGRQGPGGEGPFGGAEGGRFGFPGRGEIDPRVPGGEGAGRFGGPGGGPNGSQGGFGGQGSFGGPGGSGGPGGFGRSGGGEGGFGGGRR
ncbi:MULTISPECIES: DUF5666 domain-containing protein [Methylobacterium]|uniref:DUF5666 domain-containing protein n=1 Tax=Methylobacterium TaxID=407 RepID=UPI0028AE8E76|nr:DUF5666 domain-containing protein [Methylobacterium sp. DB0501]